MKGVLTAIQCMHNDHNMIHRDLKPQNIMIKEKDNLDSVVIIDFGLAVVDYMVDDYANCGTVMYQPPEMHKKRFAYSK